MKNIIMTSAAIAALITLSACIPEQTPIGTDKAATRQAEATRIVTNNADRKVGMPAITNFSERMFAKQIYEDRDKAITTYAYLQGLDGRLSCLGQGIGYGIPYAVQFTAPTYPQRVEIPADEYYVRSSEVDNLAQPEPNGLYMPDNAEATWYKLLDPKTGEVHAIYLEPRMTVSPFELSGPVVAAPCVHSAALDEAKANSEQASVTK